MKKLLISLIIVAFFSLPLSAQVYKGFGFKIGSSCANVNTNSLGSSILYKCGITAGIFKEIKIYDKLNFVVGINYVQKGFRVEMANTDEYGHYLGLVYSYQKNNFFSAELLLKYDGNMDKLSPYLIAGLRVDVLSSHKASFNGLELLDMIAIDNNKTFGGVVGMGLTYKPANFYTVFLEGSYNPDFTNLMDNESKIFPGYSRWARNNSFNILAGIKF